MANDFASKLPLLIFAPPIEKKGKVLSGKGSKRHSKEPGSKDFIILV